ncbi:IS30 family transposase [Paenibacillus endophyticus]|uniref:IS30 family transposase n=1 Tax=Paenibacillus endophyticus TaxID=1294268 RepID=UPI001FECFA28|nr:IS30 family transposase [Paenibacillus endophyticus]
MKDATIPSTENACLIERLVRWRCLRCRASQYPRGTCPTGTTDRGKSFLLSSLEAVHNVKVYFADPYSIWQRGPNENSNGLLQKFFPKGNNSDSVTDDQLADAIRLINNRPRKCLGWKSAHEVFLEELSHLARQFVI